MKFQTYAYMIVVNYHANFGEDPCMPTYARGVNARTCDKMCALAFTSHTHVCVHRSSQTFLWKYSSSKTIGVLRGGALAHCGGGG